MPTATELLKKANGNIDKAKSLAKKASRNGGAVSFTPKETAEWNDATWNKKVQSSVGRNIKDVVTGKAALEGAKTGFNWLTQNLRRTENRHQQITNSRKK